MSVPEISTTEVRYSLKDRTLQVNKRFITKHDLTTTPSKWGFFSSHTRFCERVGHNTNSSSAWASLYPVYSDCSGMSPHSGRKEEGGGGGWGERGLISEQRSLGHYGKSRQLNHSEHAK